MSDPVTLTSTEQAAIAAMQTAQDQAMYAGAKISQTSTSTQIILSAYSAAVSSTQKV